MSGILFLTINKFFNQSLSAIVPASINAIKLFFAISIPVFLPEPLHLPFLLITLSTIPYVP